MGRGAALMIRNSWGFQTMANRRERRVKPMLAQLMGSGVGEITAVVVRYYGGILLGTGGLVKAYGGGGASGAGAAYDAAQDAVNGIYFAV